MIEDGKFEINLRYFFLPDTNYSSQYPEYINQVITYSKKKNIFLNIDKAKADFLKDTDIDTLINEKTGLQRKYFIEEKITDTLKINKSLDKIKEEVISLYFAKTFPNRFVFPTFEEKIVAVPLFPEIRINKNDKEFYGYFFLFRCTTLHTTLIYEFLEYHLTETFNGAIDEYLIFLSDSMLMFEEQIRMKLSISELINKWIDKKKKNKKDPEDNTNDKTSIKSDVKRADNIKIFFTQLSSKQEENIISNDLVEPFTSFTISRGKYAVINFGNSDNRKFSHDWNLYVLVKLLHSKGLIDFYKKEEAIHHYIIHNFTINGKKPDPKGFREHCNRFEMNVNLPSNQKHTNIYRTFNSRIESIYSKVFS